MADKGLTNVLAWVLDSVEIIHALIKWEVVIPIPRPVVPEKGDSQLVTMNEKLNTLQTAVGKLWGIMTMSEQKCLPAKVKTELDRTNQPNGHCKELDWINDSLDVLLKVTNGVNIVLPTPRSIGLASTRGHTVHKLEKIHKRLITIHSKCLSKYQGTNCDRQRLADQVGAPATQARVPSPESTTPGDKHDMGKESKGRIESLQDRVDILEKENKQILQQKNELQNRETAEHENIEDMKTQIKSLKRDVDSLTTKKGVLEQENSELRKREKHDVGKETKGRTGKLQNRVDILEKEKKQILQQKNELHNRETAEHENIEDMKTQIKSLKREVDSLNTNKGELEQENSELRKREKHDVNRERKGRIETLQNRVEELEKENKHILQQKNEIQNRLSQAFSAQLKDNNPAIADLGDPLRPTVIAEKFSQMYDDEWTDVYQILSENGKPEEEIVQILFDVVQKCYVFCIQQSEEQSKKVVNSLISLESTKPHNLSMQTPKDPKSLDSISRNTLNELRRQTCTLSKETVINQYFEQNGSPDKTDKDSLLPFIEKSVEMCWYMVLQSPPVCLDDCKQFKTGSLFNKDLFRFYSRQGKTIDFVVWPPIYLSKGGPLLAKGVAQPKP